MNSNKSNLSIGIHLGTTSSCVGVWIDNKVEIIINEQGNRTTPSYVAFTDSDILVGEIAKNQSSNNPQNTIFGVKRLIGRKFTDEPVQKDIQRLPFTVKAGLGSKPLISTQTQNGQRGFYPEEISAILLTKLKESAEAYIGQKVQDAVIAVPAYFNDSQRQTTKDAGIIAGLNVLRIINEPTAIAIAYELDKKKKYEIHGVVVHMGAISLGVTLLLIEDGIFEVIANRRDMDFGGETFDESLVEYCASDFYKKTGLDVHKSQQSMSLLKTKCEAAKKTLSSSQEAKIEIDSLYGSEGYSVLITREEFEELCMKHFMKCIPVIESVLQEAKLEKSEINEVVFGGGSMRIPKLIEIVTEYFNEVKPCMHINPEEVVAHGVAIQAYIITGASQINISDLLFWEISCLSVGVETNGAAMTPVVPRNYTLPTRKSLMVTTCVDNQESVLIRVFQGERGLTKSNRLIGEVKLDGIAPAKRGVPQIEVEIDRVSLEESNVSVTDKSTGRSIKLSLTTLDNVVTRDEIEIIVRDAERFRSFDKELVEMSRDEWRRKVANGTKESMQGVQVIPPQSNVVRPVILVDDLD